MDDTLRLRAIYQEHKLKLQHRRFRLKHSKKYNKIYKFDLFNIYRACPRTRSSSSGTGKTVRSASPHRQKPTTGRILVDRTVDRIRPPPRLGEYLSGPLSTSIAIALSRLRPRGCPPLRRTPFGRREVANGGMGPARYPALESSRFSAGRVSRTPVGNEHLLLQAKTRYAVGSPRFELGVQRPKR